ncbi:hypothetical protein, partial [Schaalia canis]|uniref:hypothetical protein n=1 Tax=Schaalia canis TaxID=100469 RepID=UPI001402E868
TLESGSIQLLRATALLEGLSTNGPASAALLTALKADNLIDRVGLAGGYAYMGSGDEALPYAQALREVFRTGEPHLASIDPALSSAYATSMISFINGARFDGAMPGNDIHALSYLLHGS